MRSPGRVPRVASGMDKRKFKSNNINNRLKGLVRKIKEVSQKKIHTKLITQHKY